MTFNELNELFELFDRSRQALGDARSAELNDAALHAGRRCGYRDGERRRHTQPRRIATSRHEGNTRLACTQARSTLCYLPPYSPDLNPIELCFAKLKALVRAARCRSTETLWPFLGACLPHFSPEECRNYFRHCGYPGTTRS